VGKIKTVKKKTLLGVACHKKASSARSSIGTQRAADVGPRYGESSRAGPSVIGKLVCHVKTSPVLDSKPRGARYLDRGTTRWNSRAPARQGPSPEERQPVYPQRFNWFESTPRNAPRLPIQTNNHTTSEPHTHVMSNENKFPLRKEREQIIADFVRFLQRSVSPISKTNPSCSPRGIERHSSAHLGTSRHISEARLVFGRRGVRQGVCLTGRWG
jgi:hypothetical protein